jgi:hypothetical protein
MIWLVDSRYFNTSSSFPYAIPFGRLLHNWYFEGYSFASFIVAVTIWIVASVGPWPLLVPEWKPLLEAAAGVIPLSLIL